MTECFDLWRRQEHEGKGACLSLDKNNDAGVNDITNLSPAPASHINSSRLQFNLVCGSAELDRIVLPSYTAEGDYVVEIKDGVSLAHITTDAPVPVAEIPAPVEPVIPSKPLTSKTKSNTIIAATETSAAPIAAVTEVAARAPRGNDAVKDRNQFVTALPASRQLRFKVTKA
jgi:hypothetical protein